jgi:hypothetical protein
MAKKLTGKLVQSGFAVMETYDVQLEIPQELQSAFDKDPGKFIRQFLRENGQTVNSVRVMQPDGKTASAKQKRHGRQRSNHWFHLVYPGNERSGWICA